jgi:hypothetical protein
MKNSKKTYMTPMVDVMNARVEKGFAGSVDPEHASISGGLHAVVENGATGNNNDLGFVD